MIDESHARPWIGVVIRQADGKLQQRLVGQQEVCLVKRSDRVSAKNKRSACWALRAAKSHAGATSFCAYLQASVMDITREVGQWWMVEGIAASARCDDLA
tara:strand:+ start:8029 stop:8328 length:300 start_codon:yes stop_codon:yes gene_type:complete